MVVIVLLLLCCCYCVILSRSMIKVNRGRGGGLKGATFTVLLLLFHCYCVIVSRSVIKVNGGDAEESSYLFPTHLLDKLHEENADKVIVIVIATSLTKFVRQNTRGKCRQGC